MDKPHLLFKGNSPQALSYPKIEDFGGDTDAFFSAFEVADRAMAERPVLSEHDVNAQKQFLRLTLPVFLAELSNQNAVYSPINMYFPLGILTLTCDGESRAQLLNLLDAQDVEQLQKRLHALWHAVNRDDGINRSHMASSIWLNKALDIDINTAQELAQGFFTDIYRGEMGSKSMNEALHDWLSTNTGGLLQDEICDVELNTSTAFSLLSTIEYRVPWLNKFDTALTSTAVFHSSAGDLQAEFMRSSREGWLFTGERFSAISLPMADYGEMRLVLPDDGVSAETLLQDAQLLDYLCKDKQDEWPSQKYLTINLSIPKFDVHVSLQLKDKLCKLGITDVFDPAKANFNPLITTEDAALSSIIHAVRVQTTENGVTAAAFTEFTAQVTMTLPEEEEIDFTLDRPFLFEVLTENGSILFAGIVNIP